MCRIYCVVALSLALVWVVAAGKAADPPIPVPSASELTSAEKAIRDVYKADYAKKKAADQIELARKLLKAGEATTNDPTSRYALLQEARQVATKAGDVSLALNAANATSQVYAVNKTELIISTLDAATKAPIPQLRSIVELALDATEDQIQADDYIAAARLLKIAGGAAARLNNSALTTTVTAMSQDLEFIRKGFEDVAGERKILAKTPDDPISTSRVGRFLCLVKGDWEAGLPLLAKGEDEKLKAAALKDLAKPTDPLAKVEVGNAWYDLGDGFDPRDRVQARMRAVSWYRQAATSLTGFAKDRNDKRIDELTKLAATRGRRGSSGGWMVLFRSDDPTMWNTDIKKSADHLAVSLTRAPTIIRYLRMTETAKGEFVIIEMTRARLEERTEQDGYGWIGTNVNSSGGYHLGIYDLATATEESGVVSIHRGGPGNHLGWGFGHVTIANRQGASWAGKPVGKSVFEIAVKSTNLTSEESKHLLKRAK